MFLAFVRDGLVGKVAWGSGVKGKVGRFGGGASGCAVRTKVLNQMNKEIREDLSRVKTPFRYEHP